MSTEPPVFYTPEQVAETFGLDSANYVKENARHWPHLRIARQIRFTQEHVEEIARLHIVTPEVQAASRNTFGHRGRRRSA